MVTQTIPLSKSLWTKIQKVNLDLIKDRMILKHGWAEARTDKAISAYRKFLYAVSFLESGRSLVPNSEIDEVWHEHVLHTRKYMDDCNIIFGYYLHHLPFPAKWVSGQTKGACEAPSTNCQSAPPSSCATNDRTQEGLYFDNPDMSQLNLVPFENLTLPLEVA